MVPPKRCTHLVMKRRIGKHGKVSQVKAQAHKEAEEQQMFSEIRKAAAVLSKPLAAL